MANSRDSSLCDLVDQDIIIIISGKINLDNSKYVVSGIVK